MDHGLSVLPDGNQPTAEFESKGIPDCAPGNSWAELYQRGRSTSPLARIIGKAVSGFWERIERMASLKKGGDREGRKGGDSQTGKTLI